MKYWKLSLTLAVGLVCRVVFAVPPCDAKLRPGSNRTGYAIRDRGIRCEGMYVSKVARSANSLTLVGLTRGRIEFASREMLILRSSLPNRTISIQGVGIKEKTYYRLDGVIRQGEAFRWRLTDVVKERRMRGTDIGLFGYFVDPQRPERVYVPIDGEDPGDTLLRIIGSGLFSQAFWRHTPIAHGFCGSMPDWIQLNPPEFDDKPFEIILPKTLGPEICVEATAQPVTGNTWISGLWKIRSGN